ncbi:hypothetical protein E9232_005678 [Inquilinus ginsengisoli]|uniref:Uncharacterized protein n=1 Tax=Inquilinus ginsengisoli TaxID=363840 RepID=A0ABU1JWY2_9PROT|nr:hypothetical protein [Inquilinus ginsengisoli]
MLFVPSTGLATMPRDESSKCYDRWTYAAEKRAAIAYCNKFVRKILSKKAAQKSMTKTA